MILDENYEGDNSDIEDDFDGIDDDIKINDYSNQDVEIDDSRKEREVAIEKGKENSEENDDEDDQFIIDKREEEFVDSTTNITYSKKNKTNIDRMTKYEYSQLYAKMCEYIQQSKIDTPDDPDDILGTSTGSIFLVARKWIEYRKTPGFEIPLTIIRKISNHIKEEIDPANLKLPFEYTFKDEGSDNLLDEFANNFTDKPYLVKH